LLKWIDNGCLYEEVMNWTSKVDIWSKDYIIIPRNMGNAHWSLYIAFIREKVIRYYDSLGGCGIKVSKMILNWLSQEHLCRNGTSFSLSEWKHENCARMPRQVNGVDCGVFVCMAMECVLENVNFDFSQVDMCLCRKRMGLSLKRGCIVKKKYQRTK
jgi:Ulp1 family protease